MIDLETLIHDALERNASDIHLTVGEPPIFRLDGELTNFGEVPLTEVDTTAYVQERFSKITAMHIARVMEGIADNRTQVRNTRAYLLASLFNSVSTLDNQCTMQYNYDFGGSW